MSAELIIMLFPFVVLFPAAWVFGLLIGRYVLTSPLTLRGAPQAVLFVIGAYFLGVITTGALFYGVWFGARKHDLRGS